MEERLSRLEQFIEEAKTFPIFPFMDVVSKKEDGYLEVKTKVRRHIDGVWGFVPLKITSSNYVTIEPLIDNTHDLLHALTIDLYHVMNADPYDGFIVDENQQSESDRWMEYLRSLRATKLE